MKKVTVLFTGGKDFSLIACKAINKIIDALNKVNIEEIFKQLNLR